MNFRPTRAIIDLSILKKNYQSLRATLPKDAFFCPMIKADAYGHGAVQVARALREIGALHLGVALIEEGLQLRAAGDSGAILIFGPFSRDGASAMLKNSLTPVLNEWSQLEELAKAELANGGSKPHRIHLEFNTGMNRLGFSFEDAPRVRTWLDQHKGFQLEGICTHLMRGEDFDDPHGESALQQSPFQKCLAPFQGLQFKVHVLNSGACTKFQDPMSRVGPVGARPGIAIYGAQGELETKNSISLGPVLSFKTELCNLHKIQPGEAVSYGPRWRATRVSVIGVVPVGYADGYSRALSGCGMVLFRGQRAKIVGTICMDYFMIDLTDIAAGTNPSTDPIHVGEEVVLIGKQGREEITAIELADLSNTIAYEILAGLGPRVPRLYI